MSTFSKLDQDLNSVTTQEIERWLYGVKKDRGWDDKKYHLVLDAVEECRNSAGQISASRLHHALTALQGKVGRDAFGDSALSATEAAFSSLIE